jgi:T5SS/PEP-CTERM-associated repeat protein
MNATRIAVIGVIALSLAVATARAQYTADYQTNTISGVTNDWADDYLVGYTNFADVLLIQNSGVLTNHDGYLGYDSSSSNNSVLVTGPGSVWSNTYALYVGYSGAGNSLVISNGGQVVNYYRYGCMGYNFSSSNNSVLVTGAGSVWSASEELDVGYSGAGNSLVISDGGLVVNDIGYVGSWGSSSNSVLVTGPGSVWTNCEVDVGYSGAGNSLVISDGGQVLTGPSCDYYGDGYMGYDSSSTNNSVLVTGPGSVWSNRCDLVVGYSGAGNSLLISNGGQVVNGDGWVGYDSSSSNNIVLVTGPGSVWNNGNDLVVGYWGAGNSLLISNGGQVVNGDGWVGYDSSSTNNIVLVTGPGSVWNNLTTLYVGYGGSSNLLAITDGSVLASNLFISYSDPDYGVALTNLVRVDGGSLVVTNAAGNGSLVVGRAGGEAEFILNGGTVMVDALVATNGANSVVTFNGGLLKSRCTAVTNDAAFAVGNGVSTAEFHLLGGVHSFANGLRIRANALLSGCGTINGSVLVDAGGIVLADCGGTLTFTGILTNNDTMRAVNGSVLEFCGPVVNNGIIDIMDGTTNFHSSFINNGTVVDASYFIVVGITRQADDINITWTTVGGGSYVVQVTAGAADGSYTNNFTDLSPAIAIPSSGLGTTNYLDVGGATNMPARYYRIRLSSPMPPDP